MSPAEKAAREIRSRLRNVGAPAQSYEQRTQAHVAELAGEDATISAFAKKVAGFVGDRNVSFAPVPIPANAGGEIASFDGVIVRAMQDYDFNARKDRLRFDVGFSLR